MKKFGWARASWSVLLLVTSSLFIAFRYEDRAVQKAPLNILLFTADDLDRNSLGCYGGKVPDISPNIDRFASQSIRFEHAFVNAAICAPSRGILATGLYCHNSGVMGFMKMKPGSGIPVLPELLKANSYEVGILSKVSHSTPKPELEWDYIQDQADLGNGRSPSTYYRKTKEFLEQARKKGKPFYFMVNSDDPHRPYHNPDEPLTKGAEAPSRIYSPDEITVPGFVSDLPEVRTELSHYYNSTRRLDDTFGKVMQALEESGQAENTLVLFLSDNGIAIPFAKANTYYASNRTPFLVRWPGVIKPGVVNSKDLISTVDYFTTILDALKIPFKGKSDGRSFLPLLVGKEQVGRDKIFTQIDTKQAGGPTPMRSIVTANYSYIFNAWADGERVYRNNNEGKTMKAMEIAAATDPAVAERVKMFRLRSTEELYDLATDPDGLTNLVQEPAHRKRVETARKELEQWMVKTKDPLLKVFQNRNSPALMLSSFYEAYPFAKKADLDKANYSVGRVGSE
jgi:N-sulfoglucosamine sulfohydrolase